MPSSEDITVQKTAGFQQERTRQEIESSPDTLSVSTPSQADSAEDGEKPNELDENHLLHQCLLTAEIARLAEELQKVNSELAVLRDQKAEFVPWFRAKCHALSNKVKSLESPSTKLAPLPALVWKIGSVELQPCHTLGRGKYGSVVLARHIKGLPARTKAKLERGEVAVKIAPKQYLHQYRHERTFLAGMKGTSVTPSMFAYAETPSSGIIIMEKGMVALDVLQAAVPRFSEDTCKRVMKELLVAISTIHQKGFMHGDVKLANILIMQDGRLVLCDGSLSRPIEKMLGKKYHSDAKKCYYMAPEVRDGGKLRIPAASDIFSVGVVMMEIRDVDVARKDMVMAAEEAFPLGSFPEAHEVLHTLIAVEPEIRFTAERALQGPWLKECDLFPMDFDWLETLTTERKRVDVEITESVIGGVTIC